MGDFRGGKKKFSKSNDFLGALFFTKILCMSCTGNFFGVGKQPWVSSLEREKTKPDD
jgi:hypothetical protein